MLCSRIRRHSQGSRAMAVAERSSPGTHHSDFLLTPSDADPTPQDVEHLPPGFTLPEEDLLSGHPQEKAMVPEAGGGPLPLQEPPDQQTLLPVQGRHHFGPQEQHGHGVVDPDEDDEE